VRLLANRSGASAPLPALLVGLALMAPGCGEEPAPAPLPPRPVKMIEVGGGAAGTLEFPGEIRPARQADMAFEVPGKVVAFPAQEGERVEQGALLARLDPRDYQSELAKERAQLEKTKTDLERYRILYDKGVSPKADFERAQRNYEAALANFEQAQKAVEDTELRAPFDGVVARKLVEDFVNVQAKEAVLILQDDSSLEIRVSVPERDFARMTPGVPVEERNRRARPRVVVSALGDRSFPARITEISTTADPQTRTYQARFAFETPEDVNVLPGMTARVVVDVGGEAAAGAAISVPVQAVVAEPDGDPFVWVVDPATMQVSRAPVELGRMAGDRVVIEAGLEPGQTVATSGVNDLRDGAKVRRFER
jgi:RND family efflux transporter MFP subunit